MKIIKILPIFTIVSLTACSGGSYRYPMGTAEQCHDTNPLPKDMSKSKGYQKVNIVLPDGYYTYQGADFYSYDEQKTKFQVMIRDGATTTDKAKAAVFCTRDRMRVPQLPAELLTRSEKIVSGFEVKNNSTKIVYYFKNFGYTIPLPKKTVEATSTAAVKGTENLHFSEIYNQTSLKDPDIYCISCDMNDDTKARSYQIRVERTNDKPPFEKTQLVVRLQWTKDAPPTATKN